MAPVDSEKESRLSQYIAKLRDPDYKNKFVCTLFLFWTFIYVGLVSGLSGPSFLDLMMITNTELEQASTLFTAGSVGYTVGALISGLLYDKCNKLMLLVVVIIGNSVFTGVRPLCTSLPVMVAVMFLGSFFAAGIDTGCSTDLIRLWGNEGRSFMQILHFCFAVGGLLAPLVVEPFLAPKSDLFVNTTSDPISFRNTTPTDIHYFGQNFTRNESSVEELEPPQSQIIYAYVIVSGVGLTAALPFFVEFFLRKVDKNRKPGEEPVQRDPKIPLLVYIGTVFMIGAFFFSYLTVEETFMAYLAVFTVEGLHWSKADGALVTSVFWGSFAAFRFLGIFFINFLAPRKMLLIWLFLLIVSLLVFLLCSIYVVNVGIWVSSVGVGLATSIVYPTAFTWIEEHVIKVTGKVTSIIVVSTALAGIVTPVILGYLMQNVTQLSFPYLIFVQSIVLLLLFLIINIHSRCILSKYRSPNELSIVIEESEHEPAVTDML